MNAATKSKVMEEVAFLEKTVKNSTLRLLGNTPMVRLQEALPDDARHAKVYAKLESFNPGGSVKDRPAFSMIEQGIRSGRLNHDKVILEATSGNTGIAMAMIGVILKFKVELYLPSNVSEERKKILRAYGANVIFTSPLEGSDGSIIAGKKAYEANPERYFRPDQYNNPDNSFAHYNGTAPEIIKQTKGTVTHFIAGIGTSGTLMGTGRRLKEFNRKIKTYAVEPDCPLHGLEGLKHMPTSIVPGLYKQKKTDGTFNVSTEEAYAGVQTLARKEGLLVGQSSGAAFAAAIRVARQIKEGAIVVIFPDGGEKYLSTRVWE
jgi:cysteine synthase B